MSQRLFHVQEVYADGGVIHVNPSPKGGTWAFCHVAEGTLLKSSGGFVLPSDIGMQTVSNNVTEFYALLASLEALPYGWCGSVFSDSGVTIQRFEDPANVKMKGIPDEWVRRLFNVRRHLGHLQFTLLGGHPNRKELAAGFRKDGKPCSKWNVWCDRYCGQIADTFQTPVAAVGGAA